jgi:DNA primase
VDEKTQKQKLHRQWYPGRLVIPIYDNKNTLISLYGRAIPGDREPYKYLKHDYIGETKGIFNQKALEEESVHITEGCFDGLAIIEAAKKQAEVKHVCAVHGVYGLKWDLVKSKNICFVFDPDKAGETWKQHAEQGIALGKRIFYLKKEIFKGYEDIAKLWEKEQHIDFQYEEYK